jgi:O-antigen ligase
MHHPTDRPPQRPERSPRVVPRKGSDAGRRALPFGGASLTLLLLLVVLSPLPLGSVQPPAWQTMALAAAVIGLSAGALVLTDEGIAKSFTSAGWFLAGPLALGAMPMIWAVVQSCAPVPAALSHPVWGLTASVLAMTPSERISVEPDAVWPILIRCTSYALIFLSTVALCCDRKRARAALYTFSCAAGAYALYGIAAEFSSPPTILWWTKWAYAGSVTSTFVNRNTYATFAGLGLIATLAALLVELEGIPSSDSKKVRIARFLERLLTPRAGALVGFLACSVASLALSGSRAGFASASVALAAFIVLSGLKYWSAAPAARIGRGLWLTLALVIVPLLLYSGTNLVLRYEATDWQDDGRYHIFGLTWQAIRVAPWSGFGLGSFPYAFQMFRDAEVPQPYDAAHSDILQILFELGIPAGLSLIAGIAWISIACLKGFMIRRRDWQFPLLASCSSLLVGLHALFDFSLEIPAVAVTYGMLLGLGVAQRVSSRLQGI